MQTLDDYVIEERPMYTGLYFVLYHARKKADGTPVLIKAHLSQFPTKKSCDRFKREFEIGRKFCGNPCVAQYIGDISEGEYIILEGYSPANRPMTLEQKLKLNTKFEIKEFLSVAIQLAEGLEVIHQMGITHKNITPFNILIFPQGEIKLFNFEMASQFKEETSLICAPHENKEILITMSPEQTGRMNRPVDCRTDFYSLGVILYQMICGNAPFEMRDPVELMHSHIAKLPISPNKVQSTIPLVLSNIIDTLLAKAPEDRYQSAVGLIRDLQECRNLLKDDGTISTFPLMQYDFSTTFSISQLLYGRSEETKILENSLQNIKLGRQETVIVRGQAGIGKTALIKEIQKTPGIKDCYFVSGKFEQHKTNIAYSALTTAFQDLMTLFHGEGESKVQALQRKLSQVLGVNAKLIIDLIPNLKLIIGEQEPAQELETQAAAERFYMLFQKFVCALTQEGHPLILFLDDLQWADSGSLDLLTRLITNPDLKYFFFIGAYRDNEVTAAHPVNKMLGSLEEIHNNIHLIDLQSLNSSDVGKWIIETFKCSSGKAVELAEVICSQTNGNPFLVKNFLQSLHNDGLLNFTFTSGWQWKIEQIRSLHFSEELMIERMKRLPAVTLSILKVAAYVGHFFSLKILTQLMQKDAEDILSNLMPALEVRIIHKFEENDRTFSDIIGKDFCFTHDYLREIVNNLCSIDEKSSELHLSIGRLFLTEAPKEQMNDWLFDIVDHFNSAILLIADHNERAQLAHLNFQACQKAGKSGAFALALKYISVATACLSPENPWKVNYQLAWDIYMERAKLEYLNLNFSDSEKLIELLLENAQTNLKKAEVYYLRIVENTMTANYEGALQAGRMALQLLGVVLPKENLQEIIAEERVLVTQNLRDRQISDLLNVPVMSSQEIVYAVKLLAMLSPMTYMKDPVLLQVIVLKAVNLSLVYGNSPDVCLAYGLFGVLLSNVWQEYAAGFEYGMLAIKLARESHILSNLCKCCQLMASYNSHWLKPLPWADSIIEEGLQAGLDSGDLQGIGYCYFFKSTHLFFSNYGLGKVLTELEPFISFAKKAKNMAALGILEAVRLAVLKLNQIAQADDTEEQYLEKWNGQQNPYAICVYSVLKAQILYLFEQPEEALACIVVAQQYLPHLTGNLVVVFCNFYHSLILAAIYNKASKEKQALYLAQLEDNQTRMKVWADNCPVNFGGMYLLIAAEINRILGNSLETLRLYSQSALHAKNEGLLQNEALVNELLAKYYITLGIQSSAFYHLEKACFNYRNWGAFSKIWRLEKQYPIIQEFIEEIDIAKTGRGELHKMSSALFSHDEIFDKHAITQAARAISTEINLGKLLNQMLSIIIEHAGAACGFLLLKNKEDKLLIEAEARVDSNSGEPIVLQSLPCESSDKLPLTVINYVQNTKQDLILHNAISHEQFKLDPYISKHQCKSVLCMKIVLQSKLIGILYLENNLISCAFTPQKLDLLNILSAQVVTALDNAMKYREMEELNTKLIRAQTDLEAMNKELEARVHERTVQLEVATEVHKKKHSEFIATLCHELRNPLNGIMGNLQLLVEAFSENELVIDAAAAAELLKTIVDEVLDFSKIEADKLRLNIVDTSITATVLSAIKIIKIPEHKKSLLSVVTVLPEHEIFARCDSIRLKQILINLLSNAVKFTEQGKITVSLTEESDRLLFEVSDTGIGMAEEEVASLFQTYQQANPTISSRYGGTGLGLTIAKKLVEMMEGCIKVTSLKGKGSSFSFTINYIRPTTKELMVRSVCSSSLFSHLASSITGTPLHILLVEDEEINQRAIGRLLAKIGHTHDLARNGSEAVTKFRSTDYALILMDIQMPVMNGIEATKNIRQYEKEKEVVSPVPIIALSGDATEHDQERAINAGMNAFLSKPVLKKNLEDTINKCWGFDKTESKFTI